ncbi:MAG: transcription elongation factor GreAB [Myxococcota bacterium]
MGKRNKTALIQALREALAAELNLMREAQRAVAEGATHEEAKAEDDKDTRAIEQSYLARGQAVRVEELEAALAAVSRMVPRSFGEDDPIAVGALITTKEADAERLLFLAADGGGTELEGGAIVVVTLRAPLGRALLGKVSGEVIELGARARVRSIEIVSVE